MDILSQILLGNSLIDWLKAAIIFLALYFGLTLIRRSALQRLGKLAEQREKPLDEPFTDLLKQTKPLLVLVVALYLGSLALDIPAPVHDFLRLLTIAALILQAAFWGMGLIDYVIQRRVRADPRTAADTATTMTALKLIANIALWSVAILLILENVTGLEMGALLAALGIGGIAVALAVQTILGDLFSSVSIALDKPFVIGDSVAIDGLSGTIESIGLKSTRIRSVNGEQVIFSNSDLLSRGIRNLQRMDQRRFIFTLNVDYQTPPAKLAAIPGMIAEIVSAHPQVSFERAHFRTFRDTALVYEIAYVVETPDLGYFLDVQQAINLEILQRFAQEDIALARSTPSAPLTQ